MARKSHPKINRKCRCEHRDEEVSATAHRPSSLQGAITTSEECMDENQGVELPGCVDVLPVETWPGRRSSPRSRRPVPATPALTASERALLQEWIDRIVEC